MDKISAVLNKHGIKPADLPENLKSEYDQYQLNVTSFNKLIDEHSKANSKRKLVLEPKLDTLEKQVDDTDIALSGKIDTYFVEKAKKEEEAEAEKKKKEAEEKEAERLRIEAEEKEEERKRKEKEAEEKESQQQPITVLATTGDDDKKEGTGTGGWVLLGLASLLGIGWLWKRGKS